MNTSTQIKISDINIEVIKKNIKNMHLSVLPPVGRVRISAPYKVNDEAIKMFAISKISWIKKSISKFKNQIRQDEREYISGESHYLWGARYMLDVKYINWGHSIEIKGKKMIFNVRECTDAKHRERLMNEWYRTLLKEKLEPLIRKWQDIIGVEADSWGVKNMKTKWGTCNVNAKRIWFNLQMAKKPIECLEYVVVHELVHLLERNHNKKFIRYMDKFLPTWRAVREKLNTFIMDKYEE